MKTKNNQKKNWVSPEVKIEDVNKTQSGGTVPGHGIENSVYTS